MEKEMRIQGDTILHSFNYVKRKKGRRGLEMVVKELGYSPEDIYPGRWYPVEKHLKLMEVLDRNFKYNDYPICSRLGFNRAKGIGFLGGHHQKTDPHVIFGKVKEKWARFSDFGRIELRNMEEGHVDIYLCKCPSHPLYCQRMQGFFMGILLEVCRVDEAYVEEVKCTSRNNNYCKFDARWK